jgi:putative molybdopterin biosynthesis protein
VALELDFIPLTEERYDLVIPRAHYESAQLAPLLALLEDPGFRQAVQSLAGYQIEPMGKVIAEI